MQKLAWITDLHFNFLDIDSRSEFCAGITKLGLDALLISGDIGDAVNVRSYLQFLRDNLRLPIYFVLGNHDYYRGSIVQVREQISSLCTGSDNLVWLSQVELIQLSAETCLIGHDGWADGRNGNYFESKVMLNDYRLIEELKELSSVKRLEVLNALGDEVAEHFKRVLPKALERYKEIIVVTHVPPFQAACWHEGRISNDEYLPHFSCKVAGEVLRNAMKDSDAQMLVLCGHTHSSGEVKILPNLLVKTGQAVYGHPVVNEIIRVP